MTLSRRSRSSPTIRSPPRPREREAVCAADPRRAQGDPLTRFALRNLLARRRRAALTAVAVFVGVSMISGPFVFTDTINAAFHQLFANAATGANVIVASRQDISSPISAPAAISSGLVRQIRTLPGVAAAQGQVQDTATI